MIVNRAKMLYLWIYCKNYLQAFNPTRIFFLNVFTRWQQWRLQNCDVTVNQRTEAPPRCGCDFSTLFHTTTVRLNLPPSLLGMGSATRMWIASFTPPLKPLWLRSTSRILALVMSTECSRWSTWMCLDISEVDELHLLCSRNVAVKNLSVSPYVTGVIVFTRDPENWSNYFFLDHLLLRSHKQLPLGVRGLKVCQYLILSKGSSQLFWKTFDIGHYNWGSPPCLLRVNINHFFLTLLIH